MADNTIPSDDEPVATDKVTWSGDPDQNVQLMRFVGVTGSEGSKTVIEEPQIGSLTESAPGTDTASSGLNGRLQRIAQRLSSLIALLPTALGANGGLKIEGVASGTAVPVSGSVTATVSSTAVAGTVAHDSNTASNPVTSGGRAIAHGANPTAVAAGDVTDGYHNRAGVRFVIGGHPNTISYGMSITTAVSNTIIGPTINTGTILIVTAIAFVLDNGSTVFPSVVIGFGATTTPAFATTPGTSKVVIGHPACPAGGGRQKGDGSGIVGIGGDGEELRITTVGNAGGNGLYVELTGYTIES